MSPLAAFQKPIQALVERTQGLDIRVYEVGDACRVEEELQPATLQLLTEARALLGSLLTALDTAEALEKRREGHGRDSYLPFERAIDATVASKLGSRQVITEISFMAQLELAQRFERLERATAAQGLATLLCECDSSLRRTRKALTAVDAAIASVEAVPPLLDFTSELQTSLEVRREYARFRARLLAIGQPTPETLRARFRAIGTLMAILVGKAAYPEMRVSDRLLLRDLQVRVLALLRVANDASSNAGTRLWQDIVACVEMFSLVSRRQELVEHDSSLIRDALAALDAHGRLPESEWERLSALEGLDPELDELLHAPPPRAVSLASVLGRIARSFGGSRANSPGAASW